MSYLPYVVGLISVVAALFLFVCLLVHRRSVQGWHYHPLHEQLLRDQYKPYLIIRRRKLLVWFTFKDKLDKETGFSVENSLDDSTELDTMG